VIRACIDTHALSWYVQRPTKLGRRARRVLGGVDAGRTRVLVPAIVAVELSLLRDAGRNTIAMPQLEALLQAQPAFTMLVLDLAQAVEFSRLQAVRDPFDRLVVAAARANHVPLVTADAAIHASALVDTIWD
jgi:PIN domain nuclease of toxin-antitoxin system